MDDSVTTPLPSAVAPGSKPKRSRRSPYRRAPGRPANHGAALLTRVLRGVPLDRIDKRSKIGCAIRRVHDDLVAHLAGEPTAAESILIEEIARKTIIARAVGEYVLTRDTLVREGGELLPIVMQLSALQDSLSRMLGVLGLEKRAKNVRDLTAELASS